MPEISNTRKENQLEYFKRRMWIITSVTLVLPPVTGIFMLSFVGVFPYPEVFYPFTDYAAVVVIASCLFGFWLNKRFITNIIQIANASIPLINYHKHLKRLPFYYFGILFLYFSAGLYTTLYSLSTLHGFSYDTEKYLIGLLGIISGGLVTALPIFFYLSDTLGKYLAPRGIQISVAPIKLKLAVLGLFVPVLIDTLLIMYFTNRTGYLEPETIGIWFFLIIIAAVGTYMAWLSFSQSMSPFVSALRLEKGHYKDVEIIAQSLDELGLLSEQWRLLWQRVLEYEKQISESNISLRSDIHQRTEELEHERLFVDSALDNAGALLVVLDKKGRIVRFNTACEKLTGFSFTELKNNPIWEWLIPPEQLEEVKQIFTNLTDEGMDSQYENYLMKKDGNRLLVAWTNSTIRDGDGRVKFIVSIGIDISERQRKEIALHEAKNIAEHASHAKSEFLSRMSHELRTPMNAILGFGQLLEMSNTNLTPSQIQYIDEILKGGDHLLSLINEVLDLAKIEEGKFEVHAEDTVLENIVNESISMMKIQADDKGIRIIYDFTDKPAYVVNMDRMRLKQVMINIISNAIKYNRDDGEVFIDIKPIENHTIRISVRDTGYGIMQEDLNKLFAPFERLNNANHHVVEGTGIGLAISKRLMILMNGNLSVGNVSDHGCTFNIDLPYTGKVADTKAESPSTPEPDNSNNTETSGKYTVLCVEDNPANLKLINHSVSHRPDITLITARTGHSGVEMALTYLPDLILLDINLPEINGVEVIKQIRKYSASSNIPVVAITANALPSDIEKCKAAGFDEYLVKPLNIPHFLSVLDHFLPTE